MPVLTLTYYDDQRRLRVFRTRATSVTIGSAPMCDLIEDGLEPLACTVYLAENGYYALEKAGGIAVDGCEESGYLRDGGTLTLGGWLSFRVSVDEDVSAAAGTASDRPRDAQPRVRGAAAHRPGLAVFFGLLAGAGQAYNGRPLKGALFLLTSVLILPWIWSLVDAHREAVRIVASGGRTGRGGVLWVVFHGWFALNVALTAAVVLTVTGVLS